jgi:hypothetical protein
MVPLHIDCAGGPTAVAFEDQTPRRPADAGGVAVEGGGGQRLGAPASRCGARLGLAHLAEKKTRHAGTGTQCKAARGSQVENARSAADLGEDCGQTAAGEAFLGDPQGVNRPFHLDHDQPVRIESEAVEADAVRGTGFVGSGGLDDPQDWFAVGLREAGEEGCGKPGRSAAVATHLATDLMKSVTAESARQQRIEARNGEWKQWGFRVLACREAVEKGDRVAVEGAKKRAPRTRPLHPTGLGLGRVQHQ